MSKKILICDDEPDILKVVSFRLKSFGYIIITATNGQEGLTLAKETKPDLIILDYAMPIFNGDEVCRMIKADQDIKSTPIILMTASTHRTEDVSIRERGFCDKLIKPFDPKELLEKVRKYIN